MCDYSLTQLKSRPARVGDKIESFHFGTGTVGFKSVDEKLDSPSMGTAICLLPGTELAFDEPVAYRKQIISYEESVSGPISIGGPIIETSAHKTAIFRQTNKDRPNMHHDLLEFPDGSKTYLTNLRVDQKATVLQLPAAPRNEAEAEEQRRAEYAG